MTTDNKSKPLTAASFFTPVPDTFANITRFLAVQDAEEISQLNRGTYRQHVKLVKAVIKAQNLHLDDIQVTEDELNALPAQDPVFTAPENDEDLSQLLRRLCSLDEMLHADNDFPVASAEKINALYKSLKQGEHLAVNTQERFQWLQDHAPIDRLRSIAKTQLLMRIVGLEQEPTWDSKIPAASLQKIELIYDHLNGPADNFSAFARFHWLKHNVQEQALADAANAVNRATKFKLLLNTLGLSEDLREEDLARELSIPTAHESLTFLHKALNGRDVPGILSDEEIFDRLMGLSIERLVWAQQKWFKLKLLMKITSLSEEKLRANDITTAAYEQLDLVYRILLCIEISGTHNYEERLKWLLENHDKPLFINTLIYILIKNPPAASLARKCHFINNALPDLQKKVKRDKGSLMGFLKGLAIAFKTLFEYAVCVSVILPLFPTFVTFFVALGTWSNHPLNFLHLDYPKGWSCFLNSLALGEMVAGGIIILFILYKIKTILDSDESISKKTYLIVARLFFPLTLLLGMAQVVYVNYKDKNQKFPSHRAEEIIGKTFNAFPVKELLSPHITVASQADVHDRKVNRLLSFQTNDTTASGALTLPERDFSTIGDEKRTNASTYGSVEQTEPLLSGQISSSSP